MLNAELLSGPVGEDGEDGLKEGLRTWEDWDKHG